jgi:hypothetical protein
MIPKASSYCVAGLVLIAFLDPPYYPYYDLLRITVCCYSVVAAYLFFSQSKAIAGSSFALIALLFNPITPIGFSREIWLIFDVFVAAFIVSKTRYRDI